MENQYESEISERRKWKRNAYGMQWDELGNSSSELHHGFVAIIKRLDHDHLSTKSQCQKGDISKFDVVIISITIRLEVIEY